MCQWIAEVLCSHKMLKSGKIASKSFFYKFTRSLSKQEKPEQACMLSDVGTSPPPPSCFSFS